MKKMMNQSLLINLRKALRLQLFLVCLLTILLSPAVGRAENMFLPKIAKHFQTRFVKKTSVDIERLKKASQLYYMDIKAWPSDFNALKNTGYLSSEWKNKNSWGSAYEMRIDGDRLYITTRVPVENVNNVRRVVGDAQIDETTGTLTAVVFAPASIKRRSNIVLNGKRYFYEDLVVEKKVPVITLKHTNDNDSFTGISFVNNNGTFLLNRETGINDRVSEITNLLTIGNGGEFSISSDLNVASNSISLRRIEGDGASLIELADRDNNYEGFIRAGDRQSALIDGKEETVPAGFQIGTLTNNPITIASGGIPSLTAKDGSIFVDKILVKGVDLGANVEKMQGFYDASLTDKAKTDEPDIEALKSSIDEIDAAVAAIKTDAQIINLGNLDLYAYIKSNDLVPNEGGKYNIGSSARAFKNAYLDRAYLNSLYIGDKAVIGSDFTRLDGRIFGSGVITDMENSSDSTLATSKAIKDYVIVKADSLIVEEIKKKIGDVGDGTVREYIDYKVEQIATGENTIVEGVVEKGQAVVAKGTGIIGGSYSIFSDETNKRVGIGGITSPKATLDVLGDVRANSLILNSSNDKRLTLKVKDNASGDFTLTLPGDAGESAYVLKTDGAGNLYWSADLIEGGGTGEANVTMLEAGKIFIGDEEGKAVAKFVTGAINLDSSGKATLQPDIIDDSHVKEGAGILGTKIYPDFGAQDIKTEGNAEIGKLLTMTSASDGKKMSINFAPDSNSPNTLSWVLPKNSGSLGQVLMVDSISGNDRVLTWGTPSDGSIVSNPLIVGDETHPGIVKLNNGRIDFDKDEKIKIYIQDPNNPNTLNIENSAAGGVINITAPRINFNGDVYANGSIYLGNGKARIYYEDDILQFNAPASKFNSDVIIGDSKKVYFESKDGPSIYATKDENSWYSRDLHIESRYGGETGNVTIKAKDGITLDTEKVLLYNRGKEAYFAVNNEGLVVGSHGDIIFENEGDFVLTKPEVNFRFDLDSEYAGMDRTISFGGANLTDIDAITVGHLYVKDFIGDFVENQAYVLWTDSTTGLARWRLATETPVGAWRWSSEAETSIYTLDSDTELYKSSGVGIGTTAPEAKLHLFTSRGGIPAFRIDHFEEDTVDTMQVRIKKADNSEKTVFGIDNKGELFVNNNKLFINKKVAGDDSPVLILCDESAMPSEMSWISDRDESYVTGDQLFLDGSARATIGSYEMYVGGAHSLYAKGKVRSSGFVESSDRRWKKNIINISDAESDFFEKLKSIRGVYYDWNNRYLNTHGVKTIDRLRQIGVIAQDVKSKFPELVDTDDNGFLSVNYSKFAPVLIEAIRELDEKIENSKNSIYIDPEGNIDIKGVIKVDGTTIMDEERNLIANNLSIAGSMNVTENFSIRRSDTLEKLITIASDKKADKDVKGYISAKDFYIAEKDKWASEMDSMIEVLKEAPDEGACDTPGAMKFVTSTGELFICNGKKGWFVIPTIKEQELHTDAAGILK